MNEEGTGSVNEPKPGEEDTSTPGEEKESWLDDMLTKESGSKSNSPVTGKLKRRSSGSKSLPGLKSRRKSNGEEEEPEEAVETADESEEEKAGPPPLVIEPETDGKKEGSPKKEPESKKVEENAGSDVILSGSEGKKEQEETSAKEKTEESPEKETATEKKETPVEKKEKTKQDDVEKPGKPSATSESGDEDAFVSAGSDSDPWFDGKDDPVILMDTPVQAEPGKKKKGCGCWTVFATLFFFGTMLILVLVGAGLGIAYAKRNEVISEFSQSIHDSLAAKGLYADYGAFRYEFPRGLVVSDLVLFSSEAKDAPFVTLSDAGLETDWLTLAKEKGKAIDQIRIGLSGTKVTLHDAEGGDAVLEGVTGDIVFSSGTVKFDRLNSTIAGVDVELTGEFPFGNEGEDGFALPVSAGAVQELSNWLAVDADAIRPRLVARLDKKEEENGGFVFSGLITGNQFAWRELRFEAAAIPFSFDPGTDILRIAGFLAETSGGTVSGTVVVDGSKEAIVLENLRSTSNWISLLGAFSPSAKEKLAQLEMVDNPQLTVNGSIPLAGMADSTLDIQYAHWQGMIVPNGERKVPLSQISGAVKYNGRKFELRDFHLAVFGGPSKIDGTVAIQEEGVAFDFMADAEGMDLALVAKYSGIDDRLLRGNLDLVLRLSGSPSPSTWRGNGSADISDARLNGLPVVGPSQVKAGEVVPVFGRQDGIQLSGSFIVESGYFLTSDIESRSDSALLRSGAQINLATREVEFSSGAYLQGELAETTGLKDKPVVVDGKGQLGEPEVKLKEIPSELAQEEVQKALGMTATNVEKIMEMLGAPTEGEENSDGGTEEEEESDETEESAQARPEPDEIVPVRLPTVAAPLILD